MVTLDGVVIYEVIESALHDYISQILLLNALSATPNSRIVDILHLRDLYESEASHVVIQRFGFGDGQTHLMDDGIDLGVVFDFILGLEVNRSVGGRAFFDTDGFIAGKILLLDVPQGVTVTGKTDSQQLAFSILTSQIVQVVTNVVTKKADHLGCEIITVREGRVVALVVIDILDQSGIQLVQRTRMVCKPHHFLDSRQCDTLTDMLDIFFGDPYIFVCDSYLVLGFHFLYLPIFISPFGRVGGA